MYIVRYICCQAINFAYSERVRISLAPRGRSEGRTSDLAEALSLTVVPRAGSLCAGVKSIYVANLYRLLSIIYGRLFAQDVKRPNVRGIMRLRHTSTIPDAIRNRVAWGSK
jgi:hypothetical protein